jgi:predicted enzyme related to lactoylglutathione lyase
MHDAVSDAISDEITGLAGVLVWTSADRFEAMARFYRDTLALPVRTARDGFVSFAWPGDVRLTVTVHDRVDGVAHDPDRLMINLHVADIAAVAARLGDAGVTFDRHPEREPWGGWIATFHDPDGNTLQLLQPAG